MTTLFFMCIRSSNTSDRAERHERQHVMRIRILLVKKIDLVLSVRLS